MNKYAILRDVDETQGIIVKRFLIRYEEKINLKGEMFSAEIKNMTDVLTDEELKHSILIDENVDYLFEAEDDEQAKLIYEVYDG